MSCQSTQLDQARFEEVLLQLFVRHDGTDAVLAEAAWLDAKFPKDVENGTIDVAIALEFDDDEGADVGILPCLVVVEVHVVVDGQTFCLAIVDERDAMELVANRRMD